MKIKEYFVKYRISTEWHNPHNTTTHNDYSECVRAVNGSSAIEKVLGTYNFSNPNKSVEILSIKTL